MMKYLLNAQRFANFDDMDVGVESGRHRCPSVHSHLFEDFTRLHAHMTQISVPPQSTNAHCPVWKLDVTFLFLQDTTSFFFSLSRIVVAVVSFKV